MADKTNESPFQPYISPTAYNTSDTTLDAPNYVSEVKKSFPKELTCDPDTALQVTKRWKEYFPDGLEMGDSEEAHLTPPSSS